MRPLYRLLTLPLLLSAGLALAQGHGGPGGPDGHGPRPGGGPGGPARS